MYISDIFCVNYTNISCDLIKCDTLFILKMTFGSPNMLDILENFFLHFFAKIINFIHSMKLKLYF